MKLTARTLAFICAGAILAHAQISNFQHIVVIVQENRTPDNLFQGLCSPPYGATDRGRKLFPQMTKGRQRTLTISDLCRIGPARAG